MTTLADIGNPGAPAGSPEWCKYIHGLMCQTKRRANSEVSSLKYTLIDFKKSEHWKRLSSADGRPFRMWKQYVQCPEPDGLGMVVADAEAIIAEQNDKRLIADIKAIDAKDHANLRPVGTNQFSEGVDKNESDIHTRPTGTSAAAALRRLRKDRPDIHARVLAGELSPHAGMIEAGFRKKVVRKKQTRVERTYSRMQQEWTKLERRALWKLLKTEFDR